MQTVRLLSEIQNSAGALGFSVLREFYDGKVERMTCVYLRDGNGWSQKAIIAPAEAWEGLL
jgi:hypothetical protein